MAHSVIMRVRNALQFFCLMLAKNCRRHVFEKHSNRA